ncbi:DUF5590 domain-containing protein [Paenibacillus sp. CC-CFT747]|nr:DUF5590 domain-containing protein [Paenibacillus sp. CC-CFT747]
MRRKWRMAAALSLLVLLLGIAGYRFYTIIQTDTWKEEDTAIQKAKEKAGLVTTDKVEPFVGDRPYMIVSGDNAEGKKLIVWVSETEVHSELADNGMAREAARQKVLQAKPEAEIMRITPGKLENTYCWQVFYKAEKDGKKRLYYDYYQFKDGSLLDTWTLSLQ